MDTITVSAKLVDIHKLKRLVQEPNSYFMDCKCPSASYLLVRVMYILIWLDQPATVSRRSSRTHRRSSLARAATLSSASPPVVRHGSRRVRNAHLRQLKVALTLHTGSSYRKKN